MIHFEEVKHGGYNKDQVQAFFDKVGLEYGTMYREYESLYAENDALRKENERLKNSKETSAEDAAQIEKLRQACEEKDKKIASLQRELEAADHFLKGKMELIAKSIMEAEAKSKEIVERGKQEAVNLIADAEEEAQQIKRMKHAAATGKGRRRSEKEKQETLPDSEKQSGTIDGEDEESYIYPFLRAEAKRKAGEMEW